MYCRAFDQFTELVYESMKEAKAFMSDYELVKVNEINKSCSLRYMILKNSSIYD